MATSKPKRKRKDESTRNLGEKRKSKVKAATRATSVTIQKQKAAKTQTATSKPNVPGVRPMRARPYLAGSIIAKHGLVAGVTDVMVAELDKAYGKPNHNESQFCLKNAFHAVRGYMGIAENAIA